MNPILTAPFQVHLINPDFEQATSNSSLLLKSLINVFSLIILDILIVFIDIFSPFFIELVAEDGFEPSTFGL